MAKKQNTKVNRTAQETIPYELVYPNGIFMIRQGRFSKTYSFTDINFDIEPEDTQEEIVKEFGKVLNKFGPSVTLQFNIINRKMSLDKTKEMFFLKARNDGNSEYRDDYNGIIEENIKTGRNDIHKERYVTLTVEAKDIIEANKLFGTLDLEIKEAFSHIKSEVRDLSLKERLMLLHDIFKPDQEANFEQILDKYNDSEGKFSLEKLAKRGTTTKNLIAPSAIINGQQYVSFGEDAVIKSFAVNELPTSMETKFLTEISNVPCEMLVSTIYNSIPRKNSIKMVRAQSNSIKADVIKASQTAYKNNYDPSLMSESLTNARDEASYLMKDITQNSQKLFFTTFTISIIAKDQTELKEMCEMLKMKASDFSVQLIDLVGQEMIGFKTSLPFATSYIGIDSLLTTESGCAFFPFSVQELADRNGHWYGTNQVTKNMIVYNRRTSPLPNGMIFGQSGSGKSFIAKGEMIPNILDTEDDIIILDPDGEYVAMAQEFGGTVIPLETNADIHINPLDMDIDKTFGKKEDPVATKCDYLVSLCEAIRNGEEINPIEVTVIQRCGKKLYEPYLAHMDQLALEGKDVSCDVSASPTLINFYETLLEDNSPEAHRLALEIEPYAIGQYNIFSYRTNIEGHPRLIVYNLRNMPAKMKEFAMKVCLSDIWNKVIQNRALKKATWVYLDEFYLLVRTQGSATLLQEYYKRIRKYFGIMTAITQDAEDVLKTPEGRGIFNNAGFFLMMNQSQIGRSELQEQFSIPPSMLSYIKDQPPGNGLIYNGQTLVPFHYNLPIDTKLYKLMSTKPSE